MRPSYHNWMDECYHKETCSCTFTDKLLYSKCIMFEDTGKKTYLRVIWRGIPKVVGFSSMHTYKQTIFIWSFWVDIYLLIHRTESKFFTVILNRIHGLTHHVVASSLERSWAKYLYCYIDGATTQKKGEESYDIFHILARWRVAKLSYIWNFAHSIELNEWVDNITLKFLRYGIIWERHISLSRIPLRVAKSHNN